MTSTIDSIPTTSIPVEAPYPGSKEMPRWNLAELRRPPVFRWRNWYAMLGPGLLMGGSAIGGGEWLMGPTVTAKFGGGLMWLATFSILGQVVYNLEISRYTLYSGEPIFTGKFRTLPGPMFWVFVYLLLDFGSVFPYLAANAATPAAALYLGHIPDPSDPGQKQLLGILSYAIFLICLIPLIFGGKIYNALKAIMSFKILVVMGFLLMVAVFYSSPSTWVEIVSGFGKFGNVPIKRGEDLNRNGVLDPGEDWDKDGHLDIVEPELTKRPPLDTDGDGVRDSWPDFNGDDKPEWFVKIETKDHKTEWRPDLDRDGVPDAKVQVDSDGDGKPDREIEVGYDHTGRKIKFIDVDGDTSVDGDNLENVFAAVLGQRPFPDIDWTMIGFLSAFVAISGQGGLSNTPISNYTRDQGWGMGYYVGAIPSLVGGHNIQLSHEGTVFIPTPESLVRWRGWYRHVMRDQLMLWMPACFFGLALPSMLSVVFLKRGFQVANEYETPGMTADGMQQVVGGNLGLVFWYMTLFCGFMVLAPTMASTIDGIVRRWVDVFWTSSRYLRSLESGKIKYVYFVVLTVYAIFGLAMLSLAKPVKLLQVASMIYNVALGFSCWHTLVLNSILLPKELRPSLLTKILLFLAGAFFMTIAILYALAEMNSLTAK